MRKTACSVATLIGLVGLPAMALEGESLSLNPDQLPWARWQGRLSLGAAPTLWRQNLEAQKFASASLMGDYYFGRSLVGPARAGGFRATSGLIFGPRATPTLGQPGWAAGNAFSIGNQLLSPAAMPRANDAGPDNGTLPYLGVGYTGLSVRSGWSFNADLGLVAQTPGGIKLIRSQSLDDVVREMRLAPLVQLGASYAF